MWFLCYGASPPHGHYLEVYCSMKSPLLLPGCHCAPVPQQLFPNKVWQTLKMYSVVDCRQSCYLVKKCSKKYIMLIILSRMLHEVNLTWIRFLHRVWRLMPWFILKWLTLYRTLGRGTTHGSHFMCVLVYISLCDCATNNTPAPVQMTIYFNPDIGDLQSEKALETIKLWSLLNGPQHK